MTGIEQYFRDNSYWAPMPDEELTLLLSGVSTFMTVEQLANYVEHCRRFDTRPVHVTDGNQTERLVYWYCLRDDLRAMPAFFQAGEKLGLTSDQCNTLLINLLQAYKYDSRHGDETVTLATDILCHLIKSVEPFNLASFQAFLLIAQEDGEIVRAIRILKLCMNAGLSLVQSIDLVQRIYNAPGIFGYALKDFYDEIDALRANAIDPALLHEALKMMIALDVTPSWFTHFLQMSTTNSPLSQSEVLTRFLSTGEATKAAKNGDDILIDVFDDLINKDDDWRKPVNDYFPEIVDQRLVHGCLPYRISKSLEEGLIDLNNLMEDSYSQGAWVFDPASETWYSMGGKNQSSFNGVRHEFQVYDVSVLSATPVLVKVNPKKCEVLVAPNGRDLEFPQLESRLTAFLTAMPSGADFIMASLLQEKAAQKVPITGLIVSSQGVTEYTVPEDRAGVDEIGRRLQFIKGQVITELNQLWAIQEFGTKDQSPEFVSFMRDKLVSHLPPGFSIATYTFKGFCNQRKQQSEIAIMA